MKKIITIIIASIGISFTGFSQSLQEVKKENEKLIKMVKERDSLLVIFKDMYVSRVEEFKTLDAKKDLLIQKIQYDTKEYIRLLELELQKCQGKKEE